MQIALSTGEPVRTHHIRNLTAIVLEARSCLGNAGINATTGELIDFARLIWMRRAESRRMEFMTRERWPDEPTVN